MPRYWAIAPADSTDSELYDAVWEYDLANGVISIGWRELGEVSRLSDTEIRDRIRERWPDYTPGAAMTAARMLHKFYHTIVPGDVIIARRGTRQIAGVGTVRKAAHYDPDRLHAVFGQFGPEYEAIAYPHHIDVEWRRDWRDEAYDGPIFGLTTLHEVSAEKAEEILEGGDDSDAPETDGAECRTSTEFVLEKYLEDFIVSNFDAVFQGRLKLYYHPDDGRTGQQYRTEVGVIDILAQDTTTGALVVIELKKGRAADKVVGQVLKYMGWVSENLCDGDQQIRGLIICGEPDAKLDYALKMVNNVSVKYYRVDFRLED
jgi:restriction system protein